MSSLLAFFIILLSLICLSEHPFLYDIAGGSLKISLSSCCCCCDCCIMLLQRAIFDCLFFPVEGGPFEDKFGMNRILFRTSKCNYKYTFLS